MDILAEAVQRYSGIGSSNFHVIDIGFDPTYLTNVAGPTKT